MSRTHLLFALLALSCARDGDPKAAAGATPDPDSGGDGPGVIVDCPERGMSLAREMGDDDGFPGEVAVGEAGDLLLMNEHAAFVITAPDRGSTYYYYGGIVADAVAMDGCAFAGEDKLDEVGLVLGELDLADFSSSVLRAFKADTVEVISDGSDGSAAVVRATGSDATHWLVEYTLMEEALSGGGRELSGPYDMALTVDYILDPDSPVLRIQMGFENTGTETRNLLAASLLSLGGTMDLHRYPTATFAFGPLNLGYGMPWLVATDGDDAVAYAVETGNLAYAGVSGVDIALDLNQALSTPIRVAPGESDSRTTFLSVGSGSGVTATAPLSTVNPEPIPGETYTLGAVTGSVVDPSGTAVPNARVYIEAQAPDADWGVLDEAQAAADGSFSLPLPEFGTPWAWRLRAVAPGRHDSPAVDVSPGDTGITLEPSAEGSLDYAVLDGDGKPSPSRLNLRPSDGGADLTVWLDGTGTQPVPPGTYAYTATRGYEYAPVTGELTVPEGGAVALDVELQHIIDTSGWVSLDTHVHSSDSPDSRVSPADVLLHAAAHGLDLVVHTEHEHIVDRASMPEDLGYDGWIDSIGGEEVTASIPEHLTMFPVTPDGSPRGGPVEWFGRDLDELFALMRERSDGGVNLLNHPSYLGTIGWDRILAEPTLSDPTLLGLAPDAALWSWNLDGIEVMNGHSSPFSSGNGRWLDWQSMLNAGHPLVAVGSSDDHGGMKVGFPRTYVPASTDVPKDVATEEVVDGFLQGRALASTGAFARVLVDGEAELGDLWAPEGDTVDIELHIEALPEIDVTHVVVFLNCDTVLQVPATDPDGVVKLSEVLTVPVDGDAHLTIAAFGENWLPLGLPQFNPTDVPRLLTSPIYLDGDGDGVFTAPGGRECLLLLDNPG